MAEAAKGPQGTGTPANAVSSIEAAERQEQRAQVEKSKTPQQRTAEQSTATASNAGARKIVGFEKDGSPKYEEIQSEPVLGAESGKHKELEGSDFIRTSGEVPDGEDASTVEVKELPNGGGKIAVTKSVAAGAAPDIPNIVEEDGKYFSPVQPTGPFARVEIQPAAASVASVIPRTRVMREVQPVDDATLESMSAADIRAVAHDRGYPQMQGSKRTVIASFKEAQEQDKRFKE